MRKGPIVALLFFSALSAENFDWGVRRGFPVPAVPSDNPMSAAKVELGRHLFYDRRLSVNGRQSCASCHKQELAFTDGLARAKGTTGEIHPRSSMSLVNIGYVPALTWANPAMDSLEEQALVPMLGTEPVELGLKGLESRVLGQLKADTVYQRLFPAAFPTEPYNLGNITKALAAFERSIISTRSPYDRYRYGGEPTALSEAAKRGEIVFASSEKGGCFQCHGGWSFGGSIRYAGGPKPHVEFHNTGLYQSYPAPNDKGQFRAPTLRNIALTAPYMHDGSVATLEDAIEHYAAGGRAAGAVNKSKVIHQLSLTKQDKLDLIEFLQSLTDRELLTDPRWSDPWPKPRRLIRHRKGPDRSGPFASCWSNA